jgi:poly(3-hydroxyalkanoate) synthetase
MQTITDNKVKNIIENNLKSWFLDDEDVKSVVVKEVSQEYLKHNLLKTDEKFKIKGKTYNIQRVWYYFRGKIIIEYCFIN